MAPLKLPAALFCVVVAFALRAAAQSDLDASASGLESYGAYSHARSNLYFADEPKNYASSYGKAYGYGSTSEKSYGSDKGYGSAYGKSYESDNGYGSTYGKGHGYGSAYGKAYGSDNGYGSTYGKAYGSDHAYGSTYGKAYGSDHAYGSTYGKSYGSSNGYVDKYTSGSAKNYGRLYGGEKYVSTYDDAYEHDLYGYNAYPQTTYVKHGSAYAKPYGSDVYTKGDNGYGYYAIKYGYQAGNYVQDDNGYVEYGQY